MIYDAIADVYDDVMVDYSWCSGFLQSVIAREAPDAERVLELGCGTGRILELVEERFSSLTGIDISPAMLERAARRLKQAAFFRMDMRSFSLKGKFDVILCLFDTINHLETFDQWKETFSRVRTHLGRDGVFVFDMNTPGRLSRLALFPPDIRRSSGRGLMIMDICEDEITPDGNGFFHFDTEVFQPVGKNLYKRNKVCIREFAPAIGPLLELLAASFSRVEVYDEDGLYVEGSSLEQASEGRLFFVCSIA